MVYQSSFYLMIPFQSIGKCLICNICLDLSLLVLDNRIIGTRKDLGEKDT